MTRGATTEHKPRRDQPISVEISVAAHGLLDRKDLLQRLDRAVTKRVTIISAPPGSGKTSLLRAWTERSRRLGRVAFVSVDRDQQDAQRFWWAVLDAIRGSADSIRFWPLANSDRTTAGIGGHEVTIDPWASPRAPHLVSARLSRLARN